MSDIKSWHHQSVSVEFCASILREASKLRSFVINTVNEDAVVSIFRVTLVK